MQNIIRLLSWSVSLSVSLLLLVFISGCSTTSTSFTTPYSTAQKDKTDSAYNKQQAANTRLSLGLRYLTQGDYEKSKFNLDKAMEHYPESEDVQRGMAWYYEQVNELELAKKHYMTALKINSKNPSLLNQYGVFLCRHDQLQESLEFFSKSAKIVTNHDVSGTYENAATCNLMAGHNDEAESFYRKALNHNPEQRDSLLGMATIEYDKERYNRSRSYLTRFEQVAKHNSRSLWLAIRTESRLSNMDAVASYGIKLEQFFPDSKETAIYLDTRNQWLK